MLENISRYIEEGATPFEAALTGSREIAFTIVSISVSLIAVLIPLLLMGGIIGRLFREFAITLSMSILVSAIVSLTLSPMMASRFLGSSKQKRHSRLYELSERGFDAMLAVYQRCLDRVLEFLFVFLATLALSIYLFITIPKGFFPQQDTGLVTGIAESGQDVSFTDMGHKLETLGEIVLKDDAVAHVAMAVGGSGNALNTGRMYITIKTARSAHGHGRSGHRPIGPQALDGRSARLFLQSAQRRARRRARLAHPISIYPARHEPRRVE
jgi:HAE1 family hydrophobic/amphiphilic exporter-1